VLNYIYLGTFLGSLLPLCEDCKQYTSAPILFGPDKNIERAWLINWF
jgi:hypothetical protein